MPSRDVLPKTIEPMPAPVLSKPKLSPMQGTADDNTLKGGVKDQGLQGSVEDSHNTMKPLPGKVDDSQKPPLSGAVQDAGNPLKSLPGKSDPKPVLQGSASKDEGADPDEQDRELMVQWDKWRNRFLWSVQSGIQEILENPTDATLRWDEQKQAMVSKFPLGTIAWFSCQITPDKQIVNLKLLHPSGYAGYDQAVLEAVRALQGSSILRYPTSSRRKIVTQIAGVKTAETGGYNYFKFGDVERQHHPGGR